jgi:hypothetical protein
LARVQIIICGQYPDTLMATDRVLFNFRRPGNSARARLRHPQDHFHLRPGAANGGPYAKGCQSPQVLGLANWQAATQGGVSMPALRGGWFTGASDRIYPPTTLTALTGKRHVVILVLPPSLSFRLSRTLGPVARHAANWGGSHGVIGRGRVEEPWYRTGAHASHTHHTQLHIDFK